MAHSSGLNTTWRNHLKLVSLTEASSKVGELTGTGPTSLLPCTFTTRVPWRDELKGQLYGARTRWYPAYS
jgi:hypothetical protein